MKEATVCLTIAGLDPSGGAGILADVRTFAAFGCFATAAITSITFQNTTGVFGSIAQPCEVLRGQLDPIFDDFTVQAVKTGMLPSKETISETGRQIVDRKIKVLVVDPVVRSTSGFDLIDDAALDSLIKVIFPISTVVTPNLFEAERIAKMKIRNDADVEDAARIIQSMGAGNVLIKGGHLDAQIERGKARDLLFLGESRYVFEAAYYDTTATHGTGCTLSAAITASLATGKNLVEAVGTAKEFVNEAIRTAPHIGSGNSPINIRTDYFATGKKTGD